MWENIKFCATRADEIEVKDLSDYLNKLLQSLLSDKSQCFIRLDEDRTLIALMITKIKINKITKKTSLDIQCLYSYKKISDNNWIGEYKFIKKFARSIECDSITFTTRNEQVARIGSLVGFEEKHRFFEISLGGH